MFGKTVDYGIFSWLNVVLSYIVYRTYGSFYTWDSAFVGLVSSVCSDVLLQVGELGKLPLTDLAAVGLDAQVDPGVLGEVGTVGEGLTATRALVGLWFSQMDLGVQLKICFTGEILK